MNPEFSPNTASPRRAVRNIISLLKCGLGEGPGSEGQRVGGGINVAVFPYDPEHPEIMTEQLTKHVEGRAAYTLPFAPDNDEYSADLGL